MAKYHAPRRSLSPGVASFACIGVFICSGTMAIMSSNPIKWTPIGRQLLDRNKSSVFASYSGHLPADRTPLHRLGTVCSAGIPRSPIDLATRIKALPSDDVWFLCDTCIFIHAMGDVVWETILEKPVSVTRGVKKELESWLNALTHNLVAHAAYQKMIIGGPSPISPMSFGTPDQDQTLIEILRYYVNVLIGRRLLAGMITLTLKRERGRDPTPADVESRLKKEFGERGYQVAKKVSGVIENLYTDEELVVAAFLWALISGKHVIILTRDSDVQDQFFKMHSLLFMHYHSMLVAAQYVDSPKSFKCEPISPGDSRFDRVFTGADNLLVDCPPDLMNSVLPKQFELIPVYCWLLSGPDNNLRLSQNICTCETGFGELLSLKSRTHANTDKLNGKNFHVRLPGTSIGGFWGAIATDKVVPQLNIPLTDVYMALRNDEQHTSVIWNEENAH